MSHSSLIAVPVALGMALACTVTTAQDRPTSTNAARPATTLSKAAARDTQKTSMQTQDAAAAARKAKQEAGKPGTAAAQPIAPVSERSYDGCHHAKDSDA